MWSVGVVCAGGFRLPSGVIHRMAFWSMGEARKTSAPAGKDDAELAVVLGDVEPVFEPQAGKLATATRRTVHLIVCAPC